MLVLTRKEGESFWIGGVRVTMLSVKGLKTRIGIEASPDVVILREEVKRRMEEKETCSPSSRSSC